MLRVPTKARRSEPLLLVLDSLGWENTRPVSLIRQFIQKEWAEREGHKFSARDFTEKGFPSFRPSRLPRQPNTWDCGPYLLTFIEEMLKRYISS